MTEQQMDDLERQALLSKINKMILDLQEASNQLNDLKEGLETRTEQLKEDLQNSVNDFSRGITCGSEDYWRHQLEINGLSTEEEDFEQ
jgi:hypothetical protein